MYYIVFTLRFIGLAVYWFFLCTLSFLACLFAPRAKNNMFKIAKYVRPLLQTGYGIKTRISQDTDTLPQTAVYVSNHQNTLDIVTLAQAIQPNTVTVGKKQLAYIPFFGWMYWISGNILLERSVAAKAFKTLQHVVQEIKQNNLCVWLFPEGTRSYGRYEIGKFNTGAFMIAIEAQVPIVPVVVSDLNKFQLGKLDNGYVIIKYLEPINTKGLTRHQAKDLAKHVQDLFLQEYRTINQKVSEGKVQDLATQCNFKFVPHEEWMANHSEHALAQANQQEEK